RSKELMRQTIDRIGANISYSVRRGLRDYELYKESPIEVKVFGKQPKDSYAFTVTPLGIEYVSIRDWGKEGQNKNSVIVPLNKEVETPFGRVLITPSKFYTEEVFGEDIRVTKLSQDALVAYFMGNLSITQ